jgi:hypothetical protein
MKSAVAAMTSLSYVTEDGTVVPLRGYGVNSEEAASTRERAFRLLFQVTI